MTQKKFAFYILLIFCSLHISACVSVNLPSTNIAKSNGIQHSKLKPHFQKFFPKHLDAAWKNSKNGNTISYYTECNSESPINFKQIQKGLVRSVSGAKIEREMSIQISDETGLRSIVSGRVDGKTSLIDLIIFEKENCIYILTYVGSKSSFLINKTDFEQFYSSFQVNP